MKFSLQYAKLLSQKYLNIDDDIIPEIEMCLEREGDKVSLPFEVENFGTAIYKSNNTACINTVGNNYGNNYDYSYLYNQGDGYGDGYDYKYGDGNGNGVGL